MKYLFLLLLLGVVYIGFEAARVWYKYSHSKNPVIVQKDAAFGSGTPVVYVAAGDSTGVGEGASKLENTYPYKLAQSLASKNQVTYKNIAVRGATSGNVLDMQVDQISKLKPQVVTISLGGNDATHMVPATMVLANYRKIIERLTNETDAKIYLTNIPSFEGVTLLPSWYVKVIERRSKELNPQLLALETDRVKVVNIHDFGWDQFPDRSVTYSLDGFHPSDVGYQNWADAFLSKMMN